MKSHTPSFTNSVAHHSPTGTATPASDLGEVNLRLSILGFAIGCIMATMTFFVCWQLLCVCDILNLRPREPSLPYINPTPETYDVEEAMRVSTGS